MRRPRRREPHGQPLEELTFWQLMAAAYIGKYYNGPGEPVRRFTAEERAEAWRILRERDDG